MNGTTEIPELAPPVPPVRTKQGGGPPPGYGIHEKEDFLWRTPIFKKHPITGKMEATSGIFFRLWPEHVKTLQSMKEDGWPHVEVVRVASELWKRQQKDHDKNEDLADHHEGMAHENRKEDIAGVHERLPGEGTGMPPAHPGEDEDEGEGGGEEEEDYMSEESFWRGLSRTRGAAYRQALEEFRGKHYSRDGGGPQGILSRSQQRRTERDRPLLENPSFRKSKGRFGVVLLKGDQSGGVRALPLYELKEDKQRSFTRKESGVANAPFTGSSREDEE